MRAGPSRRLAVLTAWLIVLTLACARAPAPTAEAPADPMRYRLTGSGTHWDVVGSDRVLDDVRPRYPDLFAVVLDPARSDEPNLERVREHLETAPVSRANFDALNAVAIAYFELNYRGEAARTHGDSGMAFLTLGFRAAKLLAVPWRAYGEIDDAGLRDGILDFFEDAGSGTKLGTSRTVGRLVDVVESLARKESDPVRHARILQLTEALRARAADEVQEGRGE